MPFGDPHPSMNKGRGFCPDGCSCPTCREWREKGKKSHEEKVAEDERIRRQWDKRS